MVGGWFMPDFVVDLVRSQGIVEICLSPLNVGDKSL